MKSVLLTGFEPFGGDALNPSREVARALDGAVLEGARVTALELPCVFGQALQVLEHALAPAAGQPAWDLVLCLGLAANRSGFSVERVAINLDDARIPDNAGHQPVDTPVRAGAPAAHFTTLPVKRMVAALQQAGFEAAVSQTAGTFVCNHVFYGLMHWAASRPQAPRAGFMHLPPPERCTLDDQVHAVRLALVAALADGPDLARAGGAIS